jgi:uncharacterized protein YfaS (alpha-2-macroglobulin family)
MPRIGLSETPAAATAAAPAPGGQSAVPEELRSVRVERARPVGTLVSDDRPQMELQFSEPMAADSVAGAVNVEPRMALSTTWLSDSRLALRPTTPITPGTRFTITVHSGLRAATGSARIGPTNFALTIKPAVALVHRPETLAPPDALSFQLIFPVAGSPADYLRIDPPIAGAWTGPEANSDLVRFQPAEPWPEDQHFTVTLDPAARLKNGQAVGDLVPERFITPRAVHVQAQHSAHGWPTTAEPSLVFDRPVDAQSVGRALSLKPAAGGHLAWAGNMARFIPARGYLNSQTAYTLTLGTGVRDLQGRPVLRHPFTWSFQTLEPQPLASFGTGPAFLAVDATGPRVVDFMSLASSPRVVSATLRALPLDSALRTEVQQGADGAEAAPAAAIAPGRPVAEWPVSVRIRSEYGDSRDVLRLPAETAPGAYQLALGSSEQPATIRLFVTTHRLAAKRAAGQVTAWATDAAGAPAAALPVVVYAADGAVLARGNTDAGGILQLAVPAASTPAWAVIDTDDQFAIVGLAPEWTAQNGGTGNLNSGADAATPAYRGYALTDRPIYRPGQTVHFKGIVRRDMDGALSVPNDGITVTARVRDPRGNVLQTWALTPGRFGSVVGDLAVAEGAPLGDYRIELSVAGKPVASRSFGVEDYVKPELEITAKAAATRGRLLSDDRIELSGTLRYRFGQPATGVTMTVRPLSQQYVEQYVDQGDGDGMPQPRLAWQDMGRPAEHVAVDASGRFTATSALPARSYEQEYGTGARTVALEITADDGGGPAVSQLVSVTLPANGIGLGALATGQAATALPFAGDDRLRLSADRGSYRIGDTARLLIQSPESGQALLTVERGLVRATSLISLTRPWTNVTLPIRPEDAPNVYVTVHSWAADRPSDSYYTYQSRADAQLVSARIELAVEPPGRALAVAVTPDTATARPGDVVPVTLKVTDDAGQPVAAELSVAVVDEAALALRPTPPRALLDAFYSRRPLGVTTYDPFAPRRELCDCGGRGGGGGGEEGPSFADPRADFRDTALWLGQVETDANGLATVDVKLPDDLTRWRVVAVALTPDTRLGQGEASLVATQDLVVQPAWPRFLVPGDRVTLSALVQNTTDKALSTTVGLLGEGIQLTSPATRTVTIDPRSAAGVSWTATAGAPGEAVLTVQAATAGARDAVRRTVPVHALSVPESATSVGRMGAAASVPFNVPSDASDEGSVTVRLSRSVGGSILQGLDYLTGYPYGCVEQTMSKALPNAVVARAQARIGLNDSGLAARLADPIRAGIQRLYGFQHADGGWGWWEEDATDDYQTAWVVFGLAVTREAGADVDAAVIARGADYLEGRLASLDERTRAFAQYALARAGRPAVPGAPVAAASTKLDPFSLAALALAQNDGEPTSARRASDMHMLLKQLKTEGDRSWWPVGDMDGSYHDKTMASAVRSTALGLSALLALEPDHPAVPRIARWLMSKRSDHGWGTTNETAFAILALTDFLSAQAESITPTDFAVEINGRPAGSGKLGPGALTAEVVIPAAELAAGANRVTMTQTGDKPIDYVVHRQLSLARRRVDAAGPLRILRTVRRPDGKGGPLQSAERGEVVAVHLTITATDAAAYVMVEDFLPAGLEALNPRLATHAANTEESSDSPELADLSLGTADHAEVRADRVSLFLTSLPKGRTELTYLARAIRPGTFTTLPATASAMYDETTWGRSASAEFAVK